MRFEKLRTTMLAAALALTAACAVSKPAKATEQPRLPEAESMAIAAHAERDSSPGYQHWAFRWVPYTIELAQTDLVKCRSFIGMVAATAPEVAADFTRAVAAAVPAALHRPSS